MRRSPFLLGKLRESSAHSSRQLRLYCIGRLCSLPRSRMRCEKRHSSTGTRRNCHGPSKLRHFPAFARCSPLWTVCAVHDGRRDASERGGAMRGSEAYGLGGVRRESIAGWRSAARVASSHGACGSACVCSYIFVSGSFGDHAGCCRSSSRKRECTGARGRSSRSRPKPRTPCIKIRATDEDDGAGTLC